MEDNTMKKSSLLCLAFIAVVFLSGCSSSNGSPKEQKSGLVLKKFSDCNELNNYIIDTARTADQLAGIYGYPEGSTGFSPGPDAAAGDFASPDYSHTNIQEEGVDEPDRVKTDGSYIYTVSGEHFFLLKSWPSDQTSEVSRYKIEGSPQSLFVFQKKVIIFTYLFAPPIYAAEPAGPTAVTPSMKATVLDITNQAKPVLLREIYFEGALADARMVNGNVHMMITSLAYVDYSGGGGAIGGGTAPAEGADGYPAANAPEDIKAKFPKHVDIVYSGGAANKQENVICPCENVYYPPKPTGSSLSTLFTIDLADPTGQSKSVSVMGSGSIVYASSRNIYLASINDGFWVMYDTVTGPEASTIIHRFDIEGVPVYKGSGTVPGWPLNQYSMSEFDGHLRVATTEDRWWQQQPPINSVFVLEIGPGNLQPVGSITGLGKTGERLYSVRFIENKGYAVTYEQVDPLYTLDLSDPKNPLKAGSLEVPGVSTYLHPLDSTHLLAIGMSTGLSGVDLSLFDVGDFAHPRLVARETLDAGSYSSAQYDPKAFTYYAPLGALVIPITAWGQGVIPGPDVPVLTGQDNSFFNGVYIFNVDPEKGFTKTGEVDHSVFYANQDGDVYYYPDNVDRSLFIGSDSDGYFLYTLSARGLKATMFSDLTKDVAIVSLPAPPLYWSDPCGGAVCVPQAGDTTIVTPSVGRLCWTAECLVKRGRKRALRVKDNFFNFRI